MDKLNILVLHALGDPEQQPTFLPKHVFCLSNHAPNHNYLYHDVSLDLPPYVKETNFHSIILDVTFLCYRWANTETFCRLKSKYDFVRQSEAVKIALPQDEYDCNELLDDWMCEWKVDVIVSVLPRNWDVLYPKYSQQGRIVLGYTGYIDNSLISVEPKPQVARRTDIGYRARKLPPYFGRLGEEKWKVGVAVKAVASSYGFLTDIVLGDAGTLLGSSWLDFINDSRFTLGSNSGSSLLDPRGEIQRRVRTYLRRYPRASFEEVEERFFKGLDGKYRFTAISPRVLEAAALNSCQILVQGDYSGVIDPWEHYIPIRSDGADFADVANAMRDAELVKRMILNCRSAVLDKKALRYSSKAERLLDFVVEFVDKKRVQSSANSVEATLRRYQIEMIPKYKINWRFRAVKKRIRLKLERYPYVLNLIRWGLGRTGMLL